MQIKEKLNIKRGLDQNDLIFFGLRRESIQVEEEERIREVEEEEEEEEEEGGAKKGMELV